MRFENFLILTDHSAIFCSNLEHSKITDSSLKTGGNKSFKQTFIGKNSTSYLNSWENIVSFFVATPLSSLGLKDFRQAFKGIFF